MELPLEPVVRPRAARDEITVTWEDKTLYETSRSQEQELTPEKMASVQASFKLVMEGADDSFNLDYLAITPAPLVQEPAPFMRHSLEVLEDDHAQAPSTEFAGAAGVVTFNLEEDVMARPGSWNVQDAAVLEAQPLGVQAFTKEFDAHFNIKSDRVRQILQQNYEMHVPITPLKHSCSGVSACDDKKKRASRSMESKLAVMSEWTCAFSQWKVRPLFWGLKVRYVRKLWEYVAEDISGYAAAHYLDADMCHVCLVNPCRWCHAGVNYRATSSDLETGRQMTASMYLVVDRYVKPWTRDFQDAGLALCLNAGYVTHHKNMPSQVLCKATVFVSHSWGGDFKDMVTTLDQTLDPDVVVWICSFAIWQHKNISAALQSELELSPFAMALRGCHRVLVVLDTKVAVLTRCWCVLEAEFSRKWDKQYDLCLPADWDYDLWQKVGERVEQLDVAQCQATIDSDKERILAYAREGEGEMEGLNEKVRSVARNAVQRASLLAAAISGENSQMEHSDTTSLRIWRSVRGRTLVHIAAMHSRVATVLRILQRIGMDQLDEVDSDHRSPLSVAAEHAAVAGVEALVSLRAYLGSMSIDGLTPLHFSAACGHLAVCKILLDASAHIEAEGEYANIMRRPLHIAAREGHREVIRLLADRAAQLNMHCGNGATALFLAAEKDRADALVQLLVARADVNIANDDQLRRTALMAAVKVASPTVVCLLVAASADTQMPDADGDSALIYATKSDADPENQNLLLAALMPTGASGSKRCSCNIA